MGVAAAPWMAALGAALTGFGYALVLPALGVEAVHRAPPENRGVAMGACTACLDLALGVSGPVLGLIARGAGHSAVFIASGLAVLASAMVTLCLVRAAL